MSNYKNFLKDFEKSIIDSKRNIEEVELIAVSKKKLVENILPIIDAGHRAFGENQLQEVLKKWPTLKNHGARSLYVSLNYLLKRRKRTIFQEIKYKMNTIVQVKKKSQTQKLFQKMV